MSGPLGPNGARVYRIQVRKKPRPAYIEVLEAARERLALFRHFLRARVVAEEQLVVFGEADTVRDAHARYFAAREPDVMALWDSPRQREAYAWLALELANLRAAFRWAADTGDLLQGTLDLLVLKTLDAMGPLHGYGIARRIEQTSGDLLAVNYGTLYPALLKLEQEGYVASEWGVSDNNRRAKFYSLTPAGRSSSPRRSRP